MMKGWPNFAESRSAASRAIMSVFPPATKGTMMVTDLAGQSTACAATGAAANRASVITT
jgi:hypothetical protein